MSDMYAQAESESKSGNKQSEKNILAAALEKADEKSKWNSFNSLIGLNI